MNRTLFYTVILLCSSFAANGMEKANSHVTQIQTATRKVEELFASLKTDPKYMDPKSRQKALEQLSKIREASAKLTVILTDSDGWVTEESGK